MTIFRFFTSTLLALCCYAALPTLAQEQEKQQTLAVTIEGLTDEQRDNVEVHLGNVLAAEAESRFSLNKRIDKNVRAGLNALGYFSPKIDWSIDNSTLTLRIDPGKPVTIASSTITLLGEGRHAHALQPLRDAQGWRTGNIFASGPYESAKTALLSAAREQGYLTALYTQHEVAVNPATQEATITLTLDTGEQFRFGELTQSPSGISPRRIDILAKWPAGDPVSTQALNDVQQNLLGSGYFNAVTLERSRDDDQALVNVNAAFDMAKKNRVTAGIGYGTDTGPRVKLSWKKPWLNKAGHSMEVDAYVSAIGNRLALEYKIPTKRSNGSYWALDAALENTKVEDTDSRILSASAAYVTTLPWGWQGSAYLKYIDEEFTQGQQRGKSQLLTPGVSASKKKTDDAMNPTRGYSYNVTVDAANEAAVSDANFVRANVQGKWLASWGRHRLLSGLQLGGFYLYDGTTIANIPASMRFFAGGDNSVRGYDYRSLAPRDANGDLTGGQYLVASRLEYGYRFMDKWRAAFFVDAGNAYNNNGDSLYYGPGIGLHWISPVGPIRLDLGVAASDDNQIKLHIGLGPEL